MALSTTKPRAAWKRDVCAKRGKIVVSFRPDRIEVRPTARKDGCALGAKRRIPNTHITPGATAAACSSSFDQTSKRPDR